MNEKKQQLINFEYEKNFKYEDFYISKSNQHILDLFNLWPKWEKNFLNISGENYSGKSHLIDIFLKKYRGIKFNTNDFNEQCLAEIKVHQNIILEDLTKNVNEKILFSLFNIVEQDNKYLIITSLKPIVEIEFDLDDLVSRSKNFLLQFIDKPDDELIFALIIKNLSDRQISIEKKLVNYIIKRIDRSYGKIFDFIYKIDEISLKKKKPIDLKIIKEALGE
jgi:chromosomal replication initiation ATPase DnaA|tara:strand:- start:411 stop:1073 length:663 start_codon:yes stop_codon:yes gene_type:complete